MLLALIFAAIFLLPIATAILPRYWLIFWLPALLISSAWLWQQLEEVDGPGGFVAYGLVSLFILTNWSVTFGRIAWILCRTFSEQADTRRY